MKNGKEVAVLPEKELGEVRKEVDALTGTVNTYSVERDGLETGESLLRGIKSFRKGITERKSQITKPLMDSLASVRDLFRGPEDALVDAEKIIKGKILDYTLEQERVAQIEAAKITDRVEKGTLRADTAAGKLQALDSKKVKSNVRTVQKLVIWDETLIPREYLEANRTKVTEALFAGKTVSGAVLEETKIIVTK